LETWLLIQTFKLQENFSENAFFLKIQAMLNKKTIVHDLSVVEISPVDCTADAIVKIFDKNFSCNEIFHIINPHLCNLYELFNTDKNINAKMANMEDFLEEFRIHSDHLESEQDISVFALEESFNNRHYEHFRKLRVLQNKTDFVLNCVGFVWPKIKYDMFGEIIDRVLS